MPIPYELTIEVLPGFIHATVVGDRSPESYRRFLKEAYAACVKAGKTHLLLDSRMTGLMPDTASIYHVLMERSPDGARLSSIAYVERTSDDPEKPIFAETVARNQAVNVRFFPDLASATRWLERRAGSSA